MAAESSDGSMEELITTTNEPAPPQPENTSIWEWIRRHIDQVSKLASILSSMLLMAWGISLLIGGAFFLHYYRSIAFIPELDFDASVTLLAVSGITGVVTLLMLSIGLLTPALLSIEIILTFPPLKGFWRGEDGKVLPGRVVGWLTWPVIVVFGIAALFGYVLHACIGEGWWSVLGGWFFGFLVSVIIVACRLPKKLPGCPDRKQKRNAIIVFCSKIFFDAIVYPVIAVFVVLPSIRAAYPDRSDTLVIAVVVLLSIVFLNATIAFKWSGITIRQPIDIVAPIALFLLVFTVLGAWTIVANGIMQGYKFGFLRNALLILNDEGCAIVRGHGVQEKLKELDPQKDKRCLVSGVTIYSRLGSTYYVEVDGNDPSTRFTIPAQHVSSWAIIDPKELSTVKVPDSAPNLTSTKETTAPNDSNLGEEK
jgi:hypothetical protein